MTLTSKFSKDLSTLRAAANKEIFLDLKNPKLYKKIKRYYQNEVILDGEDPERDYIRSMVRLLLLKFLVL